MPWYLTIAVVAGLAIVGGLLVYLPSGALNPAYAEQREFLYGGETYIWVPDETGVPLLANRYEHGSFLHADGSAVTDLLTVRLLTEEWVLQCQQAEASRDCP